MVEDGRYRFILFSMDNTSLGHNGTLLTLVFNTEQAELLNGQTVTTDNITVVNLSAGAKEVTAPSPWLVEYAPAADPTATDQTNASFCEGGDRGRIIIKDYQILILRGDKTYTVTGQEVR